MSIRIRTDFTVQISGEIFRGSTNLKDQLEFKKLVKKAEGDGEDMARLTWIACKRLDYFQGTWEEFCDQLEDAEWLSGDELPPLGDSPSSDK